MQNQTPHYFTGSTIVIPESLARKFGFGDLERGYAAVEDGLASLTGQIRRCRKELGLSSLDIDFLLTVFDVPSHRAANSYLANDLGWSVSKVKRVKS